MTSTAGDSRSCGGDLTPDATPARVRDAGQAVETLDLLCSGFNGRRVSDQKGH